MSVLSIEVWGFLLLVCVVCALLGGVAVMIGHRRQASLPPIPETAPVPEPPESPRQEARRYFLLNETGNVLIATSLSPSGSLPDVTLAQFTEALAHLSAVFFAIAGSKDPATGEPFSLYNYSVLKRALELHPVFIRVSADSPPKVRRPFRTIHPLMFGLMADSTKAPEAEREEMKNWLDERVKCSRDALGMHADPDNEKKLGAIHAQMRAEAQRMGSRKFRTMRFSAMSSTLLDPEKTLGAQPLPDEDETPDEVEVGHITLYCECLMGVSLVSLKLAHAHYADYLDSGALEMEQDTYLFVSPAQLKKTLHDINNLPRVEGINLAH